MTIIGSNIYALEYRSKLEDKKLLCIHSINSKNYSYLMMIINPENYRLKIENL